MQTEDFTFRGLKCFTWEMENNDTYLKGLMGISNKTMAAEASSTMPGTQLNKCLVDV